MATLTRTGQITIYPEVAETMPASAVKLNANMRVLEEFCAERAPSGDVGELAIINADRSCEGSGITPPQVARRASNPVADHFCLLTTDGDPKESGLSKVTSIGASPTDNQIPTAKVVKDLADTKADLSTMASALATKPTATLVQSVGSGSASDVPSTSAVKTLADTKPTATLVQSVGSGASDQVPSTSAVKTLADTKPTATLVQSVGSGSASEVPSTSAVKTLADTKPTATLVQSVGSGASDQVPSTSAVKTLADTKPTAELTQEIGSGSASKVPSTAAVKTALDDALADGLADKVGITGAEEIDGIKTFLRPLALPTMATPYGVPTENVYWLWLNMSGEPQVMGHDGVIFPLQTVFDSALTIKSKATIDTPPIGYWALGVVGGHLAIRDSDGNQTQVSGLVAGTGIQGIEATVIGYLAKWLDDTGTLLGQIQLATAMGETPSDSKVLTEKGVADAITAAGSGDSSIFTAVFVGTGSPQNIAHGLGATPDNVEITPADGAATSVSSIGANATNVIVTVTNGKTCHCLAEVW